MVILLLLLALASSQAQAPAAPEVAGDWTNVDYRAVEVLPNACTRVWLEERRYSFRTLPGNRLDGAYQNVVRAIPAGALSFGPNCKFPAPADNPIAHQVRMWRVVGTPEGDGAWKLRAQPGAGGGDFSTLKTEEFVTTLRLSGETLADGNPGEEGLVFRRPTQSPVEARRALEGTIDKLMHGGCLEVMSALALDKRAVPEVCEARRQMAGMQGPYVSLTVTADTQIDRLPRLPAKAGPPAFERRRAVFFEFTGTFERARIPGNALVVEEGGTWRTAALWF